MSAAFTNISRGEEVRETPARRKIRVALEVLGATDIDILWEPIGQMIEMSGREGGWSVFAKFPGNASDQHYLGYSVDEVLDWIEHDPPSRALSDSTDNTEMADESKLHETTKLLRGEEATREGCEDELKRAEQQRDRLLSACKQWKQATTSRLRLTGPRGEAIPLPADQALFDAIDTAIQQPKKNDERGVK